MLTYQAARLSTLLVLLSCAAIAQTVDNTPPPPTPNPANVSTSSDNSPQVAQALVPEGVYALQLFKVLKLGNTQELAEAETQLSKLGIEPKNGWIAEYPITPLVLGELDAGIATAVQQGKLSLSKTEALNQVNALKTQLGFNISATNTTPSATPVQPAKQTQPATLSTIYTYTDSRGAKYYTDDYNSIPAAYKNQAVVVSQSMVSNTPPPAPVNNVSANQAQLDPNVLYNYYQNQGPPVLTYYPPPQDYYYLYSWVPYPFWSSGSYFSGYFMLNNFSQQVAYRGNNYFVSHHAGPVNFASGRQGNGGNWYPATSAQGARDIMSNQQNHAAPIAVAGQINRPYTAAVNANNQRNHFVDQSFGQTAPLTPQRFQNQAIVNQNHYILQPPRNPPQNQQFNGNEFNNEPHFNNGSGNEFGRGGFNGGGFNGGGFNHGGEGNHAILGGGGHMGGGRR